MTLFQQTNQKSLSLKVDIKLTDKKIDQMVYTLYWVTEEEIKIKEIAEIVETTEVPAENTKLHHKPRAPVLDNKTRIWRRWNA